MTVPLDEKVRFLQTPAAYPHRPDAVAVVETHMSWVFLAGERVFKLKKPVRFPFLDFTTLAAREANCREEVRLNRRLAPGVYRGVVPLVRRDDGTLRLGGQGPPVDWLVEMRRLPEERMLDVLLARGAVTGRELDRLAARLAGFYRRAERPARSPAAHFHRLLAQQADNKSLLLRPEFAVDHARIGRVLKALDQALSDLRPLLDRRVLERHLVEGHGDLRPEHICLAEPVVIFDCLEFDRGLRLLDPFDELAFLGMECALQGAPWLGPELIRRIEKQLDDRVPPALLRFYTAFRATLRARLTLAHLLDGTPRRRDSWEPRTDRYMALAEEALTDLGQGRPELIESAPQRPVEAFEGGRSGMTETVFSKILAGSIPAAMVYQDDQVFAFMDAGQVNPGHVIVATRRPAETILELDDEEAAALFRAAARIARAIDKAFRPDGITILQANRPAGWQTVPHVHLHVLPRHKDDGVSLTWPRKEPGLEVLRELAARIEVQS